MTLSIFLQQLINGISLGSLYGLVAIGYTMVYGILRLINFAHGDVLMMGCYFAFYGILIFSLPWWASFLAAIGLTALLGVAIDRGAYLPVRKAPRISALITAIGVSFLLEHLGLVIFGGEPRPFIGRLSSGRSSSGGRYVSSLLRCGSPSLPSFSSWFCSISSTGPGPEGP